MPRFVPKTRRDVLRRIIARLVARTRFTDISQSAGAMQMSAATAREVEDIYAQLANLLTLYSLDTAEGDDLDEVAACLGPDKILPRGVATYATPVLTLTANLAVTVAVPRGSTYAVGALQYSTTAEITVVGPGANVAAARAAAPGAEYNVGAGVITSIVTPIPGIDAVTNINAVTNGTDRESDDDFLARIKAYQRSLCRSTPDALETLAKTLGVTAHISADAPADRGSAVKVLKDKTDTIRRVVFSRVIEDAANPGESTLYIDDGTGFAGVAGGQLTVTLPAPDVLIASAAGGERRLRTTYWPLELGAAVALRKNAILQTEDVDYSLNRSNGRVVMRLPLVALDQVEMDYTASCDLVWAVAYAVEGDPTDRINWPGWRASGTRVYVRRPVGYPINCTFSVVALSGFDPATVKADAIVAVTGYLNSLDIGQNCVRNELVEQIMATPGCFNCVITTPLTDVAVPDENLARAGAVI